MATQRTPEHCRQAHLHRFLERVVLPPCEIRGIDQANAAKAHIGSRMAAIGRGCASGTADHWVFQGNPLVVVPIDQAQNQSNARADLHSRYSGALWHSDHPRVPHHTRGVGWSCESRSKVTRQRFQPGSRISGAYGRRATRACVGAQAEAFHEIPRCQVASGAHGEVRGYEEDAMSKKPLVEISFTPEMIERVMSEWEEETGTSAQEMSSEEFARRMMIEIEASARVIP